MFADNRIFGIKKPCKDCPFKKTSTPNYLGGFSLEAYAQPPSVGLPTSCHRNDYGAANEATHMCAGSLATIANDPAIEFLSPKYKMAIDEVSADSRSLCFDSVEDFKEHHEDADKYAWR